MLTLTAFLFAILQSISFYFNNEIDHPIWQYWWLFMVASYVIFTIGYIAKSKASSRSMLTIIATSGLLLVIFIWFFNDTTTIYLYGGWIAIFAAVWAFNQNSALKVNRVFYSIGILTAVALLALPVSINQITVKFPSLSGKTSFTAFARSDEIPIPSSSHYQQVRNTEEQKAHLGTQVYFTLSHDPPLLRISAHQAGVKFVIQDIIYEHVLGLFKLSLYKIGATNNMNQVALRNAANNNSAVNSAAAKLSFPASGGLALNGLPLDGEAWLQLPHMPEHALDLKDHSMVLIVRILLWAFIWILIFTWRPRSEKNPDSHV